MKTLPLLVALSLAAGVTGLQAQAQAEAPGAHFMEQWDLNADGQVTLAETREKRADVFTMFDADEDGTLNPAEWQSVAEHLATEEGQGGALAQMGEADGQAKGQENNQGKGHPQQPGPGAFLHIAMTPEFNDANGDGLVTAKEFTDATDRLFPQIDRNSDGAISLADFGRP